MASQASGVLVVDKPAGPTSHDIVKRVRAVTGARRVGHTGTLDPFATGVLPVCVGKATRLARFLAQGEKTYRARVRFGFETDTDDLVGQPRAAARPVRLDRQALGAACLSLTGSILQSPPAYSAKWVSGRRAHELARRGAKVESPPVRVEIYALDVLGVEGECVDLEVRCSPGTYVRAIARDLGRLLGLGGHLAALRRLRSGGFGLEQAVPAEELRAGVTLPLIPLGSLLPDWPAVVVGSEGRAALRHGRDLSPRQVRGEFPCDPNRLTRVLDENGELLALVAARGVAIPAEAPRVDPTLHPQVVLVGE